MAFREAVDLPDSVRGPVEKFAFCRLASIWDSVDIWMGSFPASE